MQSSALCRREAALEVLPEPRRSPYQMRWGLAVVCTVLALIGLFSANGLLTSAALIALPLICFLVWREGEPPVLVFACVFQWLQATAAIFYTNQFGVTLEDAFGDYALTVATWLSIGSVVVLALGIRVGLLGAGRSRRKELESEVTQLDAGRIAVAYAISLVISFVLSSFAWRFPSVTQPLLAIAALKWAVVFLLCYTVLECHQGYGYLAACVLVEFVSGFTGIYSEFKSVFFVLVVAAMTSPLALRGRRLAATAVCFVIMFVTGVIWTAVKMDYRAFIAEETIDEDASLPVERKFGKLADLVESLAWENIQDGLDGIIMRVSYVHYFALSIENVPSHIPYENGRLWGGSIKHVLTPRVLFPDKPTIDDSERTRTYTGIEVAGQEQSTSISIGYVGESYIDYGPVVMFVPIFLLGVLYGVVYQTFVTRTNFKLIGTSVAVAILIFNAYAMETSNIKMVGGVFSVLIVGVFFYMCFARTLMTALRRFPATARV